MSYPQGWLDIHAHFQLPGTAESQARTLQGLHQLCFMASSAPVWIAEDILAYLDRAGIAMQMLSYVPSINNSFQAANDFAAATVRQFPHRFGLLAALPINDPDACLREIERMTTRAQIPADGFAVTTVYDGIWLSNASLDPVWAELDRRDAVVHVHPGCFEPAQGRPAPIIEVAFDTTRTAVDMIYKRVFARFPSIRFVLAHAGGSLPALAGRLQLLGTEAWVPNPDGVTREEISAQLKGLYVDTAASAETGLLPAIRMVGTEHCVYGADCGVPCSTEATMEENRKAVAEVERREKGTTEQIGTNGWSLFPAAAQRAMKKLLP